MSPMRASIDIGSNSVLFLITSVKEKGFEDIISMAEIAGLGKGIDKTGQLDLERRLATIKILKKYVKEAKKYDFKPSEIIVTATEACRATSNAESFIDEVKKQTGLEIKVITGEAEAIMTARGICHGLDNRDEEFVILDVGGASTELMIVQNHPFKVIDTISTPIGSVRAKDYIDEGIFQKKMDDIFAKYDLSSYRASNITGVAGTMTSIAAMIKGSSKFEENKVNGLEISFDRFENYLNKLSNLTPEKLQVQYPFLGKRSETILSGARVARAFGIKLGVTNFNISTLGLRYGAVLYKEEFPIEFLYKRN